MTSVAQIINRRDLGTHASLQLFEKNRKAVMAGRLLKVSGKLQREGIVTHVIAKQITDLSYLLDTLGEAGSSGDRLDPTFDNADEPRGPIPAREASREAKQKRQRPPGSASRQRKTARDCLNATF